MSTTAEIISIGDELLYGQTLDTNAHWISKKLDEINIKVFQKTTVGDNKSQILKSLKDAENRADIVLITGGLGPTKDDLTKPILAEYFGVGMIRNEEALSEITALFANSGRRMVEMNVFQADLPENCTKVTNKMGTAPGMWFDVRNTVFISMPGVPYEMKQMMRDTLLPKLIKKFMHGVIHHKIIKTVGIAESTLSEMVEDWELNLPKHIKLAYLPTMGQVKLRLTAMGDNLEQLEKEVSEEFDKILPTINKYVYGYNGDELEGIIGKMLLDKGHTLSTAESCTGGYLAHLITSIPGCSRYYKGTIVSYDNIVKIEQLNIDPKLLEIHGAVSEEVVKSMAEGIRKKLGTDVGLATSGIAGPDGGSDEKPVGTIWIAYADNKKTIAKKLSLTKDRKLNIHWSALAVMNLFRINYSSN